MEENRELFEDMYLQHMKNQIKNGSLVLFTGAGFSLDAINVNNEKVPSTTELIKLIWKICYPSEEFEDGTQLQDIYETALIHHKNALRDLLFNCFSVAPNDSAKWYKEILSIPWYRCYTLNIDNTIEEIYKTQTKTRVINPISATSGDISSVSDNNLDIIYLNGKLADVPGNVIFSRNQYADQKNNDPFYKQLRTDLMTKPVVFIGTSLEENALWEHISLRGRKSASRGEKELRPRSYLIAPNLNRSKHTILAEYNIGWIKSTGKEFSNYLLKNINEECSEGFKKLSNVELTSKNRSSQLNFVSHLTGLESGYTEYLLGQEPVWSDIKDGKVAERDCFNELWDEVIKIRSKTIPGFLVVTGTAGTGKSSAIMWLALRLESEGITTAWLDSNNKLSPNVFYKQIQQNKNIEVLIINDGDIYMGSM